jgi:hypothetical protein
MPKGKAKEVKSKIPANRWTARKWAESKGEKYVRALAAAGPDFAKRISNAHAAIQKRTETADRIMRLRKQLERLEGSSVGLKAVTEMEECEKILISIVNALPDIPVKEKPIKEPETVMV